MSSTTGEVLWCVSKGRSLSTQRNNSSISSKGSWYVGGMARQMSFKEGFQIFATHPQPSTPMPIADITM